MTALSPGLPHTHVEQGTGQPHVRRGRAQGTKRLLRERLEAGFEVLVRLLQDGQPVAIPTDIVDDPACPPSR